MKPSKPIPPQFAQCFLCWFLREDIAEEVQGDLQEQFEVIREKTSPFRAKINYWYQVFNYLRPFAIRNSSSILLNFAVMFKHNLLISFRNFKKYKTSFLINITGLSTGLACVLFIYLWVTDEMSVDKFHEKEGELYQFLSNLPLENEVMTLEGSPILMTKTIVEDFPEVEAAVAVSSEFCSPKGILSYGEISQKSEGIMASSDFFNAFTFELLIGNENQVLNDKYNIVLSEELARNLFKTPENAIGKSLDWNYQWDDGVENFLVTVSGVFKSLPTNSTLQFDAVGHADLLIEADRWAGQWNSGYVRNYLVLQQGTDITAFNAKIGNYLNTKRDNDGFAMVSFVQKFSDRYLHEPYSDGKQVGGRIVYVKLLSLIAFFILFIACINFINLSTAQGGKKMKEIGVKKSLGADRKALIFQFLSESVFIAVFSLFIAGLLVFFLMPQFNFLTGTGKQISISFDSQFVIMLLGLVVFTGILAGFYPAIYLSGFNPLTILKGKWSPKTGEGQIRKGLVIFQFSLSVMLIFGMLVISNQINFVMNKNLGYNKNNLIGFEMGSNNEKPMAFISELKNLAGVEAASFMNGSILVNWDNSSGYSWNGDKSYENVVFQAPRVGYGFIEAMGMELVAGRDFSIEHNDTWERVILNESAVKFMGIENPVGQILQQVDDKKEIIGVVKDFHYGSLHKSVEPLILRFRDHGRNVVVRMKPGAEKTALANIEKLYAEFQPGYPFDYSFVDAEYQKLYNAETKVAGLSNYFAFLAMLISCLGLFGLATFTAERRAKEIGIRKIMGSSVFGIVKMLSFDFTKMVLIAVAIGLPLAYWASATWLQNFAYSIDLEWWYFMAVGLLVLLVAWLTVGIQILKAARINPLQFLRDE